MDFSEAVKLEAKQRAHFRCVVCHEPFVEVHHLLPKADGGSGFLDNAAPLCGGCHQRFGGNPELRKQLREMRDWWWERCAAAGGVAADSGMAEKIDEVKVSVLQGQRRQEDVLADVKLLLVQHFGIAQEKVMASESVSDAIAVTSELANGVAPPGLASKLQIALVEMMRVAEEEFAGVGQWYSSLSAEERKLFEQDVRRLAATADHVALKWGMFVKARWSHDQYDEHGELIFSIGANQNPTEWLRAIARWNEDFSIRETPPGG